MIPKNRIVQITLITLVLILCLILTMPASQAYKLGLYSNEVTMHGVQGKFLDGKAKVVDVDDYRVSNVSWSWRPLALFLGQFSVNWQLDDLALTGKGIVTASLWNDLQVSQSALVINGGQLQSYVPKGFKLDGDIDLDIDKLTFNQTVNSVSAQAKSTALSLTTPLGVFALNNLNLQVSGTKEEGFRGELTNMNNSNEVNVIADIQGANVSLSGHINVRSNTAKQLASLLPFIAKQQGGKWLVNWQGKLPI
jgi:hypothetical protein